MALKSKSFQDLFKSCLYNGLEKLWDITITTEDGTTFKAHKLFLSEKSYYFRAYFRSYYVSKNDNLILDFSKEVLENILIFLYIGEVFLDDRNITTMIKAADYLLIDELLSQCKKFALSKISIDNCTSLLIASHVVRRLEIEQHCYRFVEIHFGTLVRKKDSGIDELQVNIFKKLLSEDSLAVTDEATVWEAILIWLNRSDPDRLKYVPELLKCIRWKCVSKMLESRIYNHPVIRENEFCKNIELEELVLTSKQEVLQSNILNYSTVRCPKKMYIFMCRKFPSFSSYGLEIYLTYDEQLDIWRKIGETDKNYHILFALNKYVFMFNTISNTMNVFDLFQNMWVEKNTSRASRQSYCVVQYQNYLFIIGGYDFMSNIPLSIVEYYNLKTDEWKNCMSIPPISVCGAAVINEMIYVVGHFKVVNGVEMRALVYDILCDVWSDIEKPKYLRTSFGIISFRERLYLLGGYLLDVVDTAITSVEMYNPMKEQWEELPELPFRYELPDAVIMQNKLMVFESSGSCTSTFPPCTWNDEAQIWDVEVFYPFSIFSPFSNIHEYDFCCIEDRIILRELAKENIDPQTAWVKTPFANK